MATNNNEKEAKEGSKSERRRVEEHSIEKTINSEMRDIL
jgi:hypothetical protein